MSRFRNMYVHKRYFNMKLILHSTLITIMFILVWQSLWPICLVDYCGHFSMTACLTSLWCMVTILQFKHDRRHDHFVLMVKWRYVFGGIYKCHHVYFVKPFCILCQVILYTLSSHLVYFVKPRDIPRLNDSNNYTWQDFSSPQLDTIVKGQIQTTLW